MTKKYYYSFPIYPPKGEKFAPNAFDNNIGKVYEYGTLYSSRVSEDGSRAELTMEIESD